ncbi:MULTISPECIES: hypothetical protein [Afipia]|uniref:Uncharacterized protein n=1 Tax=Afipia broomeae ATCC 49717 TaxID=883078 RepID=K8P5M6_9BRAD|nr:hypothetical protein [Afipia broomeae]EKS34980.1 hypothetical protein HMPREF9695_04890 [Afipia broomeae ATCC 49717]
MKQTEPPSCRSGLVFVGKNSRGNWVAQEEHGLFGGLFINRAEAIRYALFENGHRPEAVVTAPNGLEIDMGRTPHSSDLAPARANDESAAQRRAA